MEWQRGQIAQLRPHWASFGRKTLLPSPLRPSLKSHRFSSQTRFVIIHEFCIRIWALKFQRVILVGARFSCKNGRGIRRRGEDRAAFPLVATSREKARFQATTGGLLLYFILAKGLASLASPQNIGANIVAPSIARPLSAEAMRGAVWQPVWRSGATSPLKELYHADDNAVFALGNGRGASTGRRCASKKGAVDGYPLGPSISPGDGRR